MLPKLQCFDCSPLQIWMTSATPEVDASPSIQNAWHYTRPQETAAAPPCWAAWAAPAPVPHWAQPLRSWRPHPQRSHAAMPRCSSTAAAAAVVTAAWTFHWNIFNYLNTWRKCTTTTIAAHRCHRPARAAYRRIYAQTLRSKRRSLRMSRCRQIPAAPPVQTHRTAAPSSWALIWPICSQNCSLTKR